VVRTATGAVTLGVALLGAGALAQPIQPPVPSPGKPRLETPSQPQVLPGPSDRGVVRPPDVDPGIRAPAMPEPTPNTTPVIPPPGTPGGDQRIEPR
jgi:hypothetical protein